MNSFFPRKKLFRPGRVELTEEQVEEHLSTSCYGDFELTDAVRLLRGSRIVPQRGYQFDVYTSPAKDSQTPLLIAAETKSNLLPLFYDLMAALFEESTEFVHVVLQSSHEAHEDTRIEYVAEDVEPVILQSHLYDFEDLLLNDGCFGIAVLDTHVPIEVAFCDHKLLTVYGSGLAPFERVMRRHSVPLKPAMEFIISDLHIHSSSGEHPGQFERLQMILGADTILGSDL